jgi:hypothetical protein
MDKAQLIERCEEYIAEVRLHVETIEQLIEVQPHHFDHNHNVDISNAMSRTRLIRFAVDGLNDQLQAINRVQRDSEELIQKQIILNKQAEERAVAAVAKPEAFEFDDSPDPEPFWEKNNVT